MISRPKLSDSVSLRCGFTMIELLAVLMLMLILGGISIAAFNGLTAGAATSGGARTLQSAVKLARQYAITRRIPVAVLLADADLCEDYPTFNPGSDTTPLLGRAYAIFDLRNNQYLKAWTPLPQGTVFLNGDPSDVGVSLPRGRHILDGTRTDNAAYTVINPVNNGNITFPAIYSTNHFRFFGVTFKPDGRMRWVGPDKYLWFMIYEGSQDVDATNKVSITVKRNQIVYGIEVGIAGSVKSKDWRISK